MRARSMVNALLCVLTGFVHPASAAEQAIAIRAGHLIDSVAGRMAGAQVILVRAGVIEDVGANVQVPGDARVIDLTAYTVLPGLIDAHTHLTIDQRNQDPLAELEHTAAERAF